MTVLKVTQVRLTEMLQSPYRVQKQRHKLHQHTHISIMIYVQILYTMPLSQLLLDGQERYVFMSAVWSQFSWLDICTNTFCMITFLQRADVEPLRYLLTTSPKIRRAKSTRHDRVPRARERCTSCEKQSELQQTKLSKWFCVTGYLP